MISVPKYGIIVPEKVLKEDKIRLTNQIWKLMPLREEDGDWLGKLKKLTVEIAGLYSLFNEDSDFFVLLSKMEGLQNRDIDFQTYRGCIFDSISLLEKVFNKWVP